MDKTNSIEIYPDENDILGNSLKVRLGKYRSRISTYKIKISRSHHVQGDPLLQCTEYTRNNPYNDCIQKELLGSLNDIIGCRPPLLGKDLGNICNGRFNFSTAKEMQIKKMFQQIYRHDMKFKCRKPCTTNMYRSRLLHNVPHPDTRRRIVQMVFDKTLRVSRSTFSIDSQTFLARMGGSVSSGRTLLWLLVTLLGASQVIT